MRGRVAREEARREPSGSAQRLSSGPRPAPDPAAPAPLPSDASLTTASADKVLKFGICRYMRQSAKVTRTRPQMHQQRRRSNVLACSSSWGIKRIYPVIKHLIRVFFWDSAETLGYGGVQIREKIILQLSLLLPISVPRAHLSLERLHLENNQTSPCDVESFPASWFSVVLTLSPAHCQVDPTRPASRKL